MPTKRENRHHYRTPGWKAAAKIVRARAAGRCECDGLCGLKHKAPFAGRCSAPNRTKILRDPVDPSLWWSIETGYPCSLVDTGVEFFEVVLTVAHLDHDAGTNNHERMRHLCQLCHNRYDLPHRQANAKATRLAKVEAAALEAGQGALAFGGQR